MQGSRTKESRDDAARFSYISQLIIEKFPTEAVFQTMCPILEHTLLEPLQTEKALAFDTLEIRDPSKKCTESAREHV